MTPLTFALSGVEVLAVSICKGPANRKRIYLKKSEVQEQDLLTIPQQRGAIIRKSEGDSWRVFYTVVAEPDWHEQPGVGAGAISGTTDVWADSDEIQKASHSFMRSGAIINLQHQDMNAVGKVVENFIAPSDFTVDQPGSDGNETIKKGSWVIGIEPDDALRAMIDAGELDGVSYEGTGLRTPLEKKAGYHRCPSCGFPFKGKTCPQCGATYVPVAKKKLAAKERAKLPDSAFVFGKLRKYPIHDKAHAINALARSKGKPEEKTVLAAVKRRHPALKKAATMVHEPTVPPGGPGLFGMKGAQLPAYIQHVFNDLVQKGHPHAGETYRLAIGIVTNWARGSDGKGGKVNADTQAKAVAAMAEWNSLRARAKSDNLKKSVPSGGDTMSRLTQAIAKKLGLSDEEIEEALDDDLDTLTPDEQAQLAKQAEGLTSEEEDVPLTDEQTAALAKVDGLDQTMQDLVKDEGRLASLESKMDAILSRLPEQEKSEEERRAELDERIATQETALAKAREDLDALAQGRSEQDKGPDTLKKSDDPNAQLASAIFG